MRRTPLHRLHLLVLTMLLGLGLSLSVVQAGTMSVQMGMAAMPAASGPDDCAGCEGDDGQLDVGSCLSVCGSAAHALLPGDPVAPRLTRNPGVKPGDLLAVGYGTGPDPDPPRARSLD